MLLLGAGWALSRRSNAGEPAAKREVVPPRSEPAEPAAPAAPEAPTAEPIRRAPGPEDLKAARRSVRVTVYTTSWCPHCTRARNWLRANEINFAEHDIEQSASARRDRDRINPQGGVPTVDIDGQVLTGFGEQNWERAIASAAQRRVESR